MEQGDPEVGVSQSCNRALGSRELCAESSGGQRGSEPAFGESHQGGGKERLEETREESPALTQSEQ